MPPRKRTFLQQLSGLAGPIVDGVVEFAKELPASIVTGAVTLADVATLGKNASIHGAAEYAQDELMQLRPAGKKALKVTATGAVIATSLALAAGGFAHGWRLGAAAVARGSFTSATWTVAPTIATTEAGVAASGQATAVALLQGNPQGAAEALNAGLSAVPGPGIPAEGLAPRRPAVLTPSTPASSSAKPGPALAPEVTAPTGNKAEPVAPAPSAPRTMGLSKALAGFEAVDGGAAVEGAAPPPPRNASTVAEPAVTRSRASESKRDPLEALGALGEDAPRAPATEDPGLAQLDLSRITAARRSSAGRTAGVYFCTIGGREYAIKPPGKARATDAELLGNLLASELGVPTPKIAGVPVEFEKIQPLGRSPETEGLFSDICASDRVLAMEKIEGVSLARLKGRKAEGCLTGPSSGATLRQLGEIAAFDALVGNDDRFPLRGGGGNPGNLMFTKDGRVVAIDNLPSFVPMNDVIASMSADPRPLAGSIRKFLVDHTGVDVGLEGEARIAEGMRSMGQRITKLDRATIQKLVENAKAQGEFKAKGSLDRFVEGVEAFQGGVK